MAQQKSSTGRYGKGYAIRIGLVSLLIGALCAGGYLVFGRSTSLASSSDLSTSSSQTNNPTIHFSPLESTNALADLWAAIRQAEQHPPILPGPFDTAITRFTAYLMQQVHYTRHPFDDEMASRFLTLYIKMLDPQRLYFLQKDIEQFHVYQTTLDDLILQKGSLLPAYQIFSRFYLRLRQRAEYVARLLQTNQFRFDRDEWLNLDREHARWPANMEEAKDLWRRYLKYEYLQEKLSGAKPKEIITTLARRYRRSLLLIGELDHEDILQFYLSALCQAYDPHSDYMGRAQLENFAINMQLSLFGIGALLRWDDGYCKIESLIPGGPAERSGKIQPGDRIIAVQQEGEPPVEVVDMKLQKVVDMIRGPKGTKVTLYIIPADAKDPSERKVVTLVRDEIKLVDQRAKAFVVDRVGPDGHTNRIGIIDLPSFYASVNLGTANVGSNNASTSEDVVRLLRKLEKVGCEGIILDLRKNGGGSLEEAIRTTGLFIQEGPIVQVRNNSGEVLIESDPDPEIAYKGPVLVLVSRFSASASEILAGALQDYRRALIVGDKATFGKGTVQTILELSRSKTFPPDINPGAVKVTIRKFYRPNGESTQLRGVIPDIILPSIDNVLDIGESSRDYALPWDTISPAEFTPMDMVSPYLAKLRERSETRQAQDPEFQFIRQDIQEYLEKKRHPEVSLNEQVRLKEKKEREARQKKRQQQRKARKGAPETVYEITLAQVDKPGLPPPMKGKKKTSTLQLSLSSRTDESDSKESKTPSIDITLEEAKNILLDWIRLIQSEELPPLTPPVAQASPRSKKASPCKTEGAVRE